MFRKSMDLMHHISQMILGGELYRAPVSEPLEILDIGTGTGIWALDVADKFPQANVIATDLSPIQPNCIPMNLQYEIDDCETPWTFNRRFDFIHMRNLGGGISDWPGLLEECFNHLNPGGWVEVANIEIIWRSANNSLTEESAYIRWQTQLRAAAESVNRQLNLSAKLLGFVADAGFENINDDQHKVGNYESIRPSLTFIGSNLVVDVWSQKQNARIFLPASRYEGARRAESPTIYAGSGLDARATAVAIG